MVSSDMQIVLSQIPVTERLQQTQQQHPDLAQRQFALELQKQQVRKKSEVQDTEKAEEQKIRDDKTKDHHSKESLKKEQEESLHPQGESEEVHAENGEDASGQGKFIDIRI